MKALLVDDHTLIREALRRVLGELRQDLVVLEAAECGLARRIVAENPDIELILLDLSLPDEDGFAMLEDLRERYPAISIVVLSGHEDRESVTKALDLGALGFIPKSAPHEVMLTALRLVFAGGIYIPPQILARSMPQRPAAVAMAPRTDDMRMTPEDMGLTTRQLDVLALMARGKSNKAICRVLNLGESTVKNHVTNILRLLKVNNRTEAVILVSAMGWRLDQLAKP